MTRDITADYFRRVGVERDFFDKWAFLAFEKAKTLDLQAVPDDDRQRVFMVTSADLSVLRANGSYLTQLAGLRLVTP